MMKKDSGRILSNIKIAKDVYRMEIRTSIADEVKCGQFVQVEIPGMFLRRPISVSERIGDTIVLIYKTVGEGTAVMSGMKEGEAISLFGPLGNGFPLRNEDVVLIGGGVGVPPLVETAKAYLEMGQKVTAVLGFNTEHDMILKDRMESLGIRTCIATMDGSYGTKGTVMDAIDAEGIEVPYVLACGPLPMLKAVSERYRHGCISLEARMACGIGACMGCVVKTSDGESRRVCKDGPVFEIGKVVL